MSDISQRGELERLTEMYLENPKVKEQVKQATWRLAPYAAFAPRYLAIFMLTSLPQKVDALPSRSVAVLTPCR
jgi:hypothetical protein